MVIDAPPTITGFARAFDSTEHGIRGIRDAYYDEATDKWVPEEGREVISLAVDGNHIALIDRGAARKLLPVLARMVAGESVL